MKKTGGAVEQDVFNLLKGSAIAAAISGEFYKNGTRPKLQKNDIHKEDAIVSFLTGMDGEIQSGVVNLNIYIPDIVSDKLRVKDAARCLEIESLVSDTIESNTMDGNYLFELDAMIKTYEEPEIEQHFVNTRIRFRHVTL